MNKKPGWTYIYSQELNQNIARHDESGWVYCEDGTRYSPEEIKKIIKNHKVISLQAHIIKKVFNGEIIK